MVGFSQSKNLLQKLGVSIPDLSQNLDSFFSWRLIYLLIIIVEIRVDGQRLLWLYRRPIGSRAQDIGNFIT